MSIIVNNNKNQKSEEIIRNYHKVSSPIQKVTFIDNNSFTQSKFTKDQISVIFNNIDLITPEITKVLKDNLDIMIKQVEYKLSNSENSLFDTQTGILNEVQGYTFSWIKKDNKLIFVI